MKNFLSILLLIFSLSYVVDVDAQSRVTVASDDFNRSDENPLSDGGLWRELETGGLGLELLSNRASPDAAESVTFHYMAYDVALDNDQWSEVTCAAVGVGYCGLLVRWAAFDTMTGYRVIVTDGGNLITQVVVAGSSTTLGSDSIGPIAGTTFRLEAIGDDVTFYLNNAMIISVNNPGGPADGVGGVVAYSHGGASDTQLDNFSVGNFSVGGPRRRVVNFD